MFSFFKKKQNSTSSIDEPELQVADVAEISKSLAPLIPTLHAWAKTRFPGSEKILQVFDVRSISLSLCVT